MKGACAAAMVAARILNQLEGLENTVEYWFTADEEIGGGDGARWLSETGRIKGDVCLIGDRQRRGPGEPKRRPGMQGRGGDEAHSQGQDGPRQHPIPRRQRHHQAH